MVKLISIVFVIYLIEAQLQTCIASPAHVAAAIGLVSRVVPITKWIADTSRSLFSTTQSMDQSLQLVRDLSTDQRNTVEDIMKTLKELPRIIYSETMHTNLAIETDYINTIFERAVQYQREIINGSTDHQEIYIEFSKDMKDADVSMSKIRTIILSNSILNNLRMNFTADVQVYERFCETGIPYLQIIDKLVTTLRTVSGQYYILKILAYTFLDQNSRPVHAIEKNRFIRRFYEDLKEDMDTINPYMTKASREIWTCDLGNYADDVRYANNSDSGYVELVLFKKYFAADSSFDSKRPLGKCTRAAEYMTSGSCSNLQRHFCDGQRPCRKAVDCQPLYKDPSSIAWSTTHYICMNENSANRYQSLVSKEREEKFKCEGGTKVRLTPRLRVTSHREFCNCTCVENDVHISFAHVLVSSINNVVTGIKFTKIDNVLYPQIQEGRLLPNGIVNESTVAWKRVDQVSTPSIYARNITLDMAIYLSDVELSKDRVVTGVQFGRRESLDSNSAITIFVISEIINFQTGILLRESITSNVSSASNREELDLSNRDVPTRSRRPNILDSSSNHYLRFKTSSLETDGGQTTIPFIDTQEVKTNPPSPLAGIGLFHRGQPGYGGFLSFKVITFDINPYVVDDLPLNETYLSL